MANRFDDLTLDDIGNLPFTTAISNSLATSPQNAPGAVPFVGGIPGQETPPPMLLGPSSGPSNPSGMNSLQQIAAATGIPDWQLQFGWGQEKAQNILRARQVLSEEQRANQFLRVQQQQVQMQQKRFDREAYVNAAQFLENLSKIPKTWRPFYIDKGVAMMKQSGITVDEDFTKTLKKADDEETQQVAEMWKILGQRFPNMGFSDMSQILKNPELSFKMLEEYRKMSELEVKQKRAEAFKRALSEPDQPVGLPETRTPLPIPPSPGTKEVPGEFYQAVDENARRYNLQPQLMHAIFTVESEYDPKAESKAGAQGIAQLMPATQKKHGVTDPFDPYQSIAGGTREMAQLMTKYKGNTALALAAYNAGEEAVDKHGGIPPYPETQNFVKKVMALSGRPFPMATQEAPAEYQTQAITIDRRIQKLEKIQQALMEETGTEAHQKQLEIQNQLKSLYDQKKTIAEQFKPTAGTEFGEWASAHPLYGKYGNVAQMPASMRAKAKEEFELFKKTQLQQEQTARRLAMPVPNPEQIGPKGVPAGTTYGQLEEIRKDNPALAEVWKPLDATDERDMRHLNGLYQATLRLEPLLQDPEVAKVLFAFLEKPIGWFEKNKARLTQGLTEKQIDALAQISDIASQFRVARAGLSQTASETLNIKDLIPTEGEAGQTVLFKIRALAKIAANTANDARKFYESDRRRVPGSYLEIPAFSSENSPKTGGPQEYANPKEQADAMRRKHLNPKKGE